ncbi:MAG: alpha-xylosidase [Bacteroidaceae bacterium]|nr:alpha-xylosidase [Bacteroidaceae bacterium]
MYRKCSILVMMLALGLASAAQPLTVNSNSYLMNQAVDVSTDFMDVSNTYFFADRLGSFDAASGEGKVVWRRYRLAPRQAFNTNGRQPTVLRMLDFPSPAYDNDPALKFKVDFITPRTIRIRMLTTPVEPKPVDDEVMLAGEPGSDKSWKVTETDGSIIYKSAYGSLQIDRNPWRLVLRDRNGRILTRTAHNRDTDSTQVKYNPFSFVKLASTNGRRINPVFSLQADEMIFGCGESATSLDKVGQKVNLFVTDPQGPETDQMYKPVPFYMSSRGYGVFLHTSAPVTCDFGASYIGLNKLFMGDENLDMFLFVGTPAEILDEYTNLVGKPAMPPLWSFGTWMSRITYFSQEEGMQVAENIRNGQYPCDVIHFDTGWFQTDWQCDYKFSDKFPDAQKMINDLKSQGFHICLWQLPYFTPKNTYFNELIEKDMYVRNGSGGLPYEDVCLDFSNPETVKWYQEKLAGLLSMGVGAIKADFGEGAPLDGLYSNGKSGWYEHNLYPVRYNKAVNDITFQTNGDHIMWARSAWAGSQRYPLHWGGDAATNNTGMLGTVRAGLSFGLSGFAFWSHDMGGFVKSTPEELYCRWLPFGFLTSHTRAHGDPPTEPWLYDSKRVQDTFRKSAEMKYKLMPYVYAQAKECTEKGLPMVRALFIEYPDDPAAWRVETEYMFGSQILVAPLMESGMTARQVYLPKGKWTDYQTGRVFEGGCWQQISAEGELPIIMLVRDGALLPHVALAQSTDKIDWKNIQLKAYSVDVKECSGLVCLPSDNLLQTVRADCSGQSPKITGQARGTRLTIMK